MKKIILGLSCIILTQLTIAQEEIAGVTPAKSIEISGDKLHFNGAGLREKFFLDLYVGALYLTNKSTNSEAIIEADESMAITLDIVSRLISSEKMINAINEGFDKSTGGNTAALKNQISAFKDAFKEEIVTGDHFVIAYIKDKQSVEIQKNGKMVKSISGLNFKKALFGIWLGNKPADEDLMEGMLGIN